MWYFIRALTNYAPGGVWAQQRLEKEQKPYPIDLLRGIFGR
jgi:hypothetical protein